MNLRLKLAAMKGFSPEAIVEQVPELRRLQQLRNALIALKSPLAERPAFRKRIVELLGDDAMRARPMSDLGMACDE